MSEEHVPWGYRSIIKSPNAVGGFHLERISRRRRDSTRNQEPVE